MGFDIKGFAKNVATIGFVPGTLQTLTSPGKPEAPQISDDDLQKMIELLTRSLGAQQRQGIETTRQAVAGAPKAVQRGAQAQAQNQGLELLSRAIANLQGTVLQSNLAARQQQFQVDVANQQASQQALTELGFNLALLLA